tara:strand:+ start:1096 stop:1371 length:276 start_codon:yes stop_codon:yes gene_type:complete
MKNDTIKVILSTITALTGIGGTYKTMENRVTDLEERILKQEQILRVEIEVQKMKQDQIIDELKSKAKIDSLRFASEMIQQEYLIKLQSMEN